MRICSYELDEAHINFDKCSILSALLEAKARMKMAEIKIETVQATTKIRLCTLYPYKVPLHAGTAMILGQKSLLPEFLCNLWNFQPDESSTVVNAPIVRSPALRPPNTLTSTEYVRRLAPPKFGRRGAGTGAGAGKLPRVAGSHA